eukprot:157973_1
METTESNTPTDTPKDSTQSQSTESSTEETTTESTELSSDVATDKSTELTTENSTDMDTVMTTEKPTDSVAASNDLPSVETPDLELSMSADSAVDELPAEESSVEPIGPPRFAHAEAMDFKVGRTVYVRSKRATIAEVDFPLIFFIYDGTEVVMHRSFAATPEQFEVNINDNFQLNESESETPQDWQHSSDEEDMDDSQQTVAPDASLGLQSTGTGGGARAALARLQEQGGGSGLGDGTVPGGEKEKEPRNFTDPDQKLDISETDADLHPPPEVAMRAVDAILKAKKPHEELIGVDGGEHTLTAIFPQACKLLDCKGASFSIPNKVANIEFDRCKDISVELTSVISSIDISNCSGCTISCSSTCLSFVIEKCSDCQISFLDTGADVLIVSTLTKGIDLHIIQPTEFDEENADFIEHTIVEELSKEEVENLNQLPQFITRYDAQLHSVSTQRMHRSETGDIENLNP